MIVNDEEEEEIQIDLGTCCACGGVDQVRNIIMLPLRTPSPGYGWGCVICGLPPDGAVAVLCDGCLSRQQEPSFVCNGPPTAKGRVPIGESTTPFDHDDSKHTLEPPGVPNVTFGVCENCGCTDESPCYDAEFTPCHWITPTLCSACLDVGITEVIERVDRHSRGVDVDAWDLDPELQSTKEDCNEDEAIGE